MYDPILCMNVPDSAKTKDANYKFNVKYGNGKPGIKEEITSASSMQEARNIASLNAKGWGFEIIPVNGIDTIDKAIRSIDGISEIRRAIGYLKNAMSVLGPASETQYVVRDIQDVISKLEDIN